MTTTTVDVEDAMKSLSQLLEAVERGEEVVIERAGAPVATLAPYVRKPSKLLPPGSLKGTEWVIPDDFDEPMDGLFEALDDDGLDALPA